jgi:DNA-binding beta-propeller fold protein YncE
MNPLAASALVGTFCLASLTANANDILVAGFGGDVINRYDGTSGVLIGTFASHATMDGPTALAFNPGGDLLVLNEFSHNVLRFDGTSGAFLSTLITSAALGSVGATDPDDMEIGPDGNLYITSHFNTGGNIWKFDGTTGAYLGVHASNGPPHHTHGLAFGPGGDLFQGQVDARSVERFDGTTGASLGTYAFEPTMFPTADLAFGASNLYVTLDGGAGVARFNSVGAFTGYLIPAGPGESYWGIMVDGGFVYLGNKATGTIKKYDDATGAFIGDFITGAPAPYDMIRMNVPEPGGGLLLVGGLGIIAISRRKRRLI